MDSVSKVILASLPLCRDGNDESPKGEALWLSELPALPSPRRPALPFPNFIQSCYLPQKLLRIPRRKVHGLGCSASSKSWLQSPRRGGPSLVTCFWASVPSGVGVRGEALWDSAKI